MVGIRCFCRSNRTGVDRSIVGGGSGDAADTFVDRQPDWRSGLSSLKLGVDCKVYTSDDSLSKSVSVSSDSSFRAISQSQKTKAFQCFRCACGVAFRHFVRRVGFVLARSSPLRPRTSLQEAFQESHSNVPSDLSVKRLAD
jgi:hypothetical protein